MSDTNSNTLTKPAVQAVTPTAPERAVLSAPSSQSGRTQFALALMGAMKDVPTLPLDGYNEYHRYHYTTSEAVIEAARKALIANGLVPLPVEATLNGHEKEGENRYELELKFILLHQSGETVAYVRHWPVCPEKGRPLDKATAAARTLCLSYLLCDILLIARKNPPDEEANARDDRQAQQARPAKPKKPARELPKDGAELEVRLKEQEGHMVVKNLCKPGDLVTAVRAAGVKAGYVPELVRWPAPAIQLAAQTAREFIAACKAGQGPVHAS